MSRKFLNEQQIKLYTDDKNRSRNYIRNPEKRKLFKEIINSNFLKVKPNENRVSTFNKLWRKAQRISRIIYGVGTNISQRSKISANFIRENTYYRSSFLSNFRLSKSTSVENSVHMAEVKTYKERMSKFLAKYGDTKIQTSYGRLISNNQGEGKTLNDYMQMFENGEISKEEMSAIIKNFKESNTYYFKMSIGSD